MMTYLVVAYIVFWLMTFGLVLSVFVRQRAVERELHVLKELVADEERGIDRS